MRSSAHFTHVLFQAVLLAGCSGQLVIEDPDTAGGGSCQSSAECGPGRVCQGFACVESAGRCSSAIPDGDCPLGRLCQGGICVVASDGVPGGGANANENGNGNSSVDVFDCSECETGDFCDGFQCVDPTDSAKICSEFVLDGACPLGEVCVGGACTPIKAGKNDCAPARPEGLCPAPGYCVDGFCLPIDERPCSGIAVDGACPAGQSCIEGSCSVVVCGSTAPFGACSSGLVCLDGTCRPETALLTCEELDCAGRNREACVVDADGVARCGACLDGFSDDGAGTCVPESCLSLGCDAQLRVCDTSVVPAVCGDCLDGYKEGAFGCEPVVCADLSCSDDNRTCVAGSTAAVPAACGDCLAGFVQDGGVCRLATCDDIQTECDALQRICDAGNTTTGATCGECVPGASEGANGQCTSCDVPGGCQACTGTADCGAGTYCDPLSGFCAQDCTPNTAGDSDDQECVAEGFGAGSVCSPNGRCARTGVGGGVCGAGLLEGEIVEPIVAILVDQSGSMRDAFEDGWRWFEVERALFGDTNATCLNIDDDGDCCNDSTTRDGCSNRNDRPTYISRAPATDPGEVGLITRFQDEIQFAMVFYETQNEQFDVGPFDDDRADLRLRYPLASNPAAATDDPSEALEPALGVRDDLALFYARHMWEGQTPTSDALFAVDEYLRLIRQARADAGEPIPPTYIVLATDGAPDYANSPELVSCANPDPTTISEYRVLEAVNFARRDQVLTLQDGVTTVDARGTQTFALSVGAGIALNHLQDVANAGAGVPTMVTNVMPELDDIGSLPANYGSLDTSNPRDIPNSDNPYFNAYSAPSPVYGLTAQTCTRDSDCGSGRRCAGGYCCQGNCEESLCADSFFDTGNNDTGEPRLPPDVGCNAADILDRMTGCIARRFGQDYDELFADLSSRESCDGSNPCARGNETCVGGDCVVASCTPAGTTDAVGNEVMAPCFVGDDAASLGNALEGVFNSVLSCTVELAVSDPITKNGVVWLDDDPIPDDQWRVTGVNRIEVVGDACATLKDGNPHFLSVEINTCAGGG